MRVFFLTILKRCCWLAVVALAMPVQANPAVTSVLPQACYSAGEFNQEKSIPGLPTLLRSSGSYLFDCHRGVIWLQREPLVDGFLFSQDQQYFRLGPEGELQPLAARFHNAIGRLMLTLFAAKEEELERQFDIVVANASPLTFELIPKQRRLKKAIQSLFIVQVESAQNPETRDQGVEISLVDATGQTLRIVNRPLQVFATSEGLFSQCKSLLGPVANASCDRLSQATPEG